MNPEVQQLRLHIKQLDSLFEGGVLAPETYREARATVQRNLAALVLSEPAEDALAPTTRLAELAPSSVPATMALKPMPRVPSARTSGAGRLWAALAVVVLGAGGVGYWWSKTPGTASSAHAAVAPTPATQAPHAMGNDQLVAMVEALATRLKAHPADAEGWAMLARSYANIGRHNDAAPAYVKALALRKKDPVLMADYADELAVLQGRKLAGKPMVWVKRALALDPEQPKALLLAATDAFDRQDFAQATQLWSRVLKSAPPGSAVAMQAQAGLDELRDAGKGAGMGMSRGSVLPTSAPAVIAGLAGAGDARVAGTVSLDPKLAARTQPTDTVFVYARAAQGSRMPLAMMQRQVKDFPLRFELDDSMAMSPQNRLSGAREVVVAVRVSRSGQAVPQPGDLEGLSDPVAVGTRDLKLQVARVIQ
jgi:cytochrome c-type biogenesis protein CcmH